MCSYVQILRLHDSVFKKDYQGLHHFAHTGWLSAGGELEVHFILLYTSGTQVAFLLCSLRVLAAVEPVTAFRQM